jgi:hypothetical protein
MTGRAKIASTALLLIIPGFLLADADVPELLRLWQPLGSLPQIPPNQNLPVVSGLPSGTESRPAVKNDSKADGLPAAGRLQPQSRLALVRYISGEFARAVRPLPRAKRGFRFKAGAPVDEQALHRALASGGSSANPGDTVQITRIDFRDTEIVLDINGGTRERKRCRDHIQIGVGGAPTVRVEDPNADKGFQRAGSILVVDFGRPLPDMTPDEFKQLLSPFLDFSKQRSASVQWVETLPPEFQQAIKEKRAVVGMDRDMVIAALGRPERKVRERDPDGRDTEDWIYGQPPGKTVFVKFAGETVIAVREYP